MGTDEFIEQLRAKYGCRRSAWDAHPHRGRWIELQRKLIESEEPTLSNDQDVRVAALSNKAMTEIEDGFVRATVDLVLGHVHESDRNKCGQLRFVQLWTNDLNAVATRAPSGDSLILLNRGTIISFAYSGISFADCAMSTPLSKAGAFVRDSIPLFIAALESLGGPIVSDVCDIDGRQGRILLGDRYKAVFGDMLAIAMVSFAIAHEVGHHVLGHQGNLTASSLILGGQPLEHYRYSRDMEYAADRYGWYLLRQIVAEQMKPAHVGEAFALCNACFAAPLLVMALFEASETLINGNFKRQADATDNHPCGYERRTAIEVLAKESVDEELARFVTCVNFFFFKSIPAFFKGFVPDGGAMLLSSPILGYGEIEYQNIGS
jgi:hypothetical protein